MTQHSPHPAYRPDIDGLRAVAVLAVLVFHAFPAALPGGFVGVDIFFVISGYLISAILFAGMAAGTFSFADFYTRRVKRIFPALLVVLACCLLAGWLAFAEGRVYSDTLRLLGKHVAAAGAFMANVLLWTEAGYFDAASTGKPLLHLWSLGVEEQFYIFWPLALVAAHRLRLSPLLTALLVAAASLALGLASVARHPDFAFYLPFTRMWELLAGAMLAWSQLHSPRLVHGIEAHHWRRELLALAGLVLTLVALTCINASDPFPGALALVPVAGAVLLIAAGPSAGGNRLLLGNPLAVFIGRISYPLYLWHWPLLSGLYLAGLRHPSPLLRAAMLALALLLAWLTMRFVEMPVRFSRGEDGRRKLHFCAAFMLLLLAAGLLTWQGSSFFVVSERQQYAAFFDNTELRYTRLNGIWPAYRSDCDFYDVFDHHTKKAIAPSCYTPPPGRYKVVLVWGDSHAQQFLYGLKMTLPPDVALLQIVTSGCAPAMRDMRVDELHSCNRSNRFARAQIARIRPDVLVLAQHVDHEKTDWDALAEKAHALGAKRVLLLGPVPQWEPQLWMVVAGEYWDNTPSRIATHHVPEVFATDSLLRRRYTHDSHLAFLSLIAALCDERGCLAYTDAGRRDGLMTFDYGHLTLEGSRYVARHFVTPAVEQLLSAP